MNHLRAGRNFWIGLVVGSVVAAGFLVAPDLLSGVADAQEVEGHAGTDIVLVRCKTTAQQFTVSSFQGSASTPARKTDSCADTLSEMAKAGFVIDRAGYSDDADFIMYTLIR